MNRHMLEGMEARSKGQSMKSNPYRDGTFDHYKWKEGWEMCNQHIAQFVKNMQTMLDGMEYVSRQQLSMSA